MDVVGYFGDGRGSLRVEGRGEDAAGVALFEGVGRGAHKSARVHRHTLGDEKREEKGAAFGQFDASQSAEQDGLKEKRG